MNNASQSEVLLAMAELNRASTAGDIARHMGLDSGKSVMRQLMMLAADGRVTNERKNSRKVYKVAKRVMTEEACWALGIASVWYRQRDPELSRLLAFDELSLRQMLVNLGKNIADGPTSPVLIREPSPARLASSAPCEQESL